MNAETLVEWATTYFGRGRFAAHSQELSVQSPFAIDHKTHLIINVKKRVYHCWLSNASGHLSKLLWLTHKHDWKAIARTVFGYGELDLSKIGPQDLEEPELIDLKLRHLWDIRYSWLPRRMFEYLGGRGFDLDQLIKQFDIMVLADESNHMSPWFGRIIFPIHESSKVVNYIGRSVLGTRPKYLFPRAEECLVPKSQLLFDATNPQFAPELIIVEGVLDALKLWQLGYNAVATFGQTSSLVQAALLTQIPLKKSIMYDSGALLSSLQLAKRLIEFGEETVNIIPPPEDGRDAGDLESPDEVEYLKKHSRVVSSKQYLNAWILNNFGRKN